MNIGKAAKASKVSAKMIRYYEQIGLIPAASRTDSGYRAYTQADVNQLHFIRRARDLGFSVAEISDLLNLWNNHSARSLSTKTRIKKSNASSIQLVKLANATCRCVVVQFRGVYIGSVLHQKITSSFEAAKRWSAPVVKAT